MPENKSDPVPNPGRREFIKKSVRLAASAALTVISGTLLREAKPPILVPKELPNDVLTEKELRQANIQIYNTQKIKLYLRRNVFEFPLFEDAASGKIAGVNVVLVDNGTISWNASQKIAEDARLVYQHIKSSPEQEWLSEKERLQQHLQDLRNQTQSLQEQTQQDTEKTEKELGNHVKNKDQWIQQIAENNGILGYFVHIKPEDSNIQTLIEKHPELKNKVYIFVAVGDGVKPNPQQSFVTPEVFEKNEITKQKINVYWIRRFIGGELEKMPGTTLRHEIGHYDQSDLANSEFEADTRAYKSFVDAWDKFKETGDTSGYPFVFETDKGLTFTRRENPPPKERTSVRQT